MVVVSKTTFVIAIKSSMIEIFCWRRKRLFVRHPTLILWFWCLFYCSRYRLKSQQSFKNIFVWRTHVQQNVSLILEKCLTLACNFVFRLCVHSFESKCLQFSLKAVGGMQINMDILILNAECIYQCWTWSGFRIAIQPDSAIQNRIQIGLDLEKNSTGSDMDIQTALITAVKCLIRVFFRI